MNQAAGFSHLETGARRAAVSFHRHCTQGNRAGMASRRWPWPPHPGARRAPYRNRSCN